MAVISSAEETFPGWSSASPVFVEASDSVGSFAASVSPLGAAGEDVGAAASEAFAASLKYQ